MFEIRRITAQQTMVAQEPRVAGLSDSYCGTLWDLVSVALTFGFLSSPDLG